MNQENIASLTVYMGPLRFREEKEQWSFTQTILRGNGSKYQKILDLRPYHHTITGQLYGRVGMGPGLMDFLKDGAIIPYSPGSTSISHLEASIQKVWFGKTGRTIPAKDQPPSVVVYTGTKGKKLFEDMIKWRLKG